MGQFNHAHLITHLADIASGQNRRRLTAHDTKLPSCPIADWIIEVVDGLARNGEDANEAVEEKVKAEVGSLCAKFPLY